MRISTETAFWKFQCLWIEYSEEEREEDNRKNLLQYLYLSNPEELERLGEADSAENSQAGSVTFTFSPVWTGFVNLITGSGFQFPEEWIGQVNVVKESDRNEWVFTLRTEAAEPPALLRIRVYGQDEPRDVFDNLVYEQLEKRGVYEYYAALVKSSAVPEQMQLSMEEIRERFSIAKS